MYKNLPPWQRGQKLDTTKRLISSPKCGSVEVINNPARPGSNHMEINYINYIFYFIVFSFLSFYLTFVSFVLSCFVSFSFLFFSSILFSSYTCIRVWSRTLSGRLCRVSSLFSDIWPKKITSRFIMRIIELEHLETTWILQEQVHPHV